MSLQFRFFQGETDSWFVKCKIHKKRYFFIMKLSCWVRKLKKSYIAFYTGIFDCLIPRIDLTELALNSIPHLSLKNRCLIFLNVSKVRFVIFDIITRLQRVCFGFYCGNSALGGIFLTPSRWFVTEVYLRSLS